MTNLSKIYPIPYNTLASNIINPSKYPIFTESDISNYEQAIVKLLKGIREGKASENIADLLLKIHEGKFNYQTVILFSLKLASMAVPALGILTPFVGLFFSHLNKKEDPQTINIDDIFKAMQPAIQNMINETLTKDNIADMDTQASNLEKQLSVYQDQMYIYHNINKPTTTDVSDLHRAIDNTIDQLNNNLVFFQKDGYKDIGLTYYILFATLHLLLLSDKIKNGLEWGYNKDSIPEFQRQFYFSLKEHSEYVESIIMTDVGYKFRPTLDFYRNCTSYVSLWSTFSPQEYPQETDIEKTLSFRLSSHGLFQFADLPEDLSIGTRLFLNGCSPEQTANINITNSRGETWTSKGHITNIPLSSCSDNFDIPLNDPIIRVESTLNRGTPSGRGFIFHLKSGNTRVFPKEANLIPDASAEAYMGYKIAELIEYSDMNTDGDRYAIYKQIPEEVFPENIIGKPNPNNNNKIPIKGIPVEKYQKNNGWKSISLDVFKIDTINTGLPMSGYKGASLTFQITNLTSGQYKIRYRVATNNDGNVLSLNGFETNTSTPLPNTKKTNTNTSNAAFLDYATTNGKLGYYMLVDGPTVQINPGNHQFTITLQEGDTDVVDPTPCLKKCEEQFTNDLDKWFCKNHCVSKKDEPNLNMIFDRIEFVPISTSPTPPPTQIPLNDVSLTDSSEHEIWKSDTYYSGYLSGKVNAKFISMNSIEIDFEYFDGKTSLGIIPQSYSSYDIGLPHDITKWSKQKFNRVTAKFSNFKENPLGKQEIMLTNLIVNDLTSNPSQFTAPEDLEKITNQINSLFTSSSQTELAQTVTDYRIDQMVLKVDALSDDVFGVEKKALRKLVNQAKQLSKTRNVLVSGNFEKGHEWALSREATTVADHDLFKGDHLLLPPPTMYPSYAYQKIDESKLKSNTRYTVSGFVAQSEHLEVVVSRYGKEVHDMLDVPYEEALPITSDERPNCCKPSGCQCPSCNGDAPDSHFFSYSIDVGSLQTDVNLGIEFGLRIAKSNGFAKISNLEIKEDRPLTNQEIKKVQRKEQKWKKAFDKEQAELAATLQPTLDQINALYQNEDWNSSIHPHVTYQHLSNVVLPTLPKQTHWFMEDRQGEHVVLTQQFQQALDRAFQQIEEQNLIHNGSFANG
ncbi:hypothetical protein AT270_30505, partial [Bacillus cereus]|uniref:insecticidal delta-endotoxin Cry8Ea1 family protein n=2 Tax=Bacillus TaxID=1386 RepID=UPI00077B1ADD